MATFAEFSRIGAAAVVGGGGAVVTGSVVFEVGTDVVFFAVRLVFGAWSPEVS